MVKFLWPLLSSLYGLISNFEQKNLSSDSCFFLLYYKYCWNILKWFRNKEFVIFKLICLHLCDVFWSFSTSPLIQGREDQSPSNICYMNDIRFEKSWTLQNHVNLILSCTSWYWAVTNEMKNQVRTFYLWFVIEQKWIQIWD